ncbi:MAG TPA: oligosaccharide flippase family protein [Candidatus Acidoferrales bacterium]|nr:oligosaccharide flippase family protein [Candidatus Acidoferrales bacterium]
MAEPAASAPSAPKQRSATDVNQDVATQSAQLSRSLRNVLWLSTGSVLTRAMNLARGIVLARLLTPFDFGVYGLGGSIVGIKEKFADIGAGTFLVYRPRQVAEHTETAFWVNLGLSTSLLAILAALAPLLARLYREPLLSPVLVILALGIWARTNSSIHQSLLRTQSRFRAMAVIDYCGSGAWLAVAVLLAWKGFGVWALAVSATVANTAAAVLFVTTQGWRPRFRISKASFRLLGGFSFWYLGQGLAWFLVGNLDNLLVGRFLGMTLLGIYALAFNYALFPVTMIGNAIGSVAYAELPWLYDRPQAFWSAYREFSRVLALAGCGAAFAAVVAAPEIFPLVFGHKWDAAIVPFQILSVYAAMRCLWLDPFLAMGNFRLSSLMGVFAVAAAAAAIWFGMRFGLAGVACAMLAIQMGFDVAAVLVTMRSWRKLTDLARATTPYLAGAVLAALLALACRRLALAGGVELKIGIFALTLGVYGCIYGLLFRSDLARVLGHLLDRQVKGGEG